MAVAMIMDNGISHSCSHDDDNICVSIFPGPVMPALSVDANPHAERRLQCLPHKRIAAITWPTVYAMPPGPIARLPIGYTSAVQYNPLTPHNCSKEERGGEMPR